MVIYLLCESRNDIESLQHSEILVKECNNGIFESN